MSSKQHMDSDNAANLTERVGPAAPEYDYGFASLGPFTPRRIAPGEYVIENPSATIKIRVEGAAFAEWVARAITQYDKCVNTIEKHLNDCFGCEIDTYEWNETEGDNDTIPCATCSQLEDLVLVRHNAEVEASRRANKSNPDPALALVDGQVTSDQETELQTANQPEDKGAAV